MDMTADDPDPYADVIAHGEGGGIDPVYFGVMFIMNNAIRPDHAARGRGPECGGGEWARMSMDTSVHKGRHALHAGAVRHHVVMVSSPWLVTSLASWFHG
jgi:hypothetical protein